jgi:hypothetical protein
MMKAIFAFLESRTAGGNHESYTISHVVRDGRRLFMFNAKMLNLVKNNAAMLHEIT